MKQTKQLVPKPGSTYILRDDNDDYKICLLYFETFPEEDAITVGQMLGLDDRKTKDLFKLADMMINGTYTCIVEQLLANKLHPRTAMRID